MSDENLSVVHENHPNIDVLTCLKNIIIERPPYCFIHKKVVFLWRMDLSKGYNKSSPIRVPSEVRLN